MIEFELNGKNVEVPEGMTIIEAADQAGEYIPRFCYHKKLSIAANCRMCLVQVEKAPKPLPACATPITPEMKVNTKSDFAMKAQREVMEFLLINHPLDCPICDQGGECELQDLSVGYGQSHSEYEQPKRSVASEDIGPLIETEMTRCIQCTRCVRFGEEVAGLRELGVINRGEKEEIGTYVQHFVKSELSGNVIDLCPVGALTNKPARYRMRAWEAKEHATIAPHDCLGTNMYVHTRSREYSKECEVFRAVPRENEAINEVWISDRDRFAVEGLYHHDRVQKPLMKKNGQLVEVDWQYALEAIVHLTSHIKDEMGADRIAGIAGNQSTVEECYLLQKMIRAWDSPHVDHRVRELDFSDQNQLSLFPQLNQSIDAVESCDTLLLVGSNVRFEQPVLSARIFKAVQDGLSVMAVNPIDYPFVYALSEKCIDSDLVQPLAQIAKALIDKKQESVEALSSVSVSDTAIAMAERLLSSEKAAIFMGAYAQHHPKAAEIRQLLKLIEKFSGATVGVLTDGPNAAGAWLSGCVPHRGPAGASVSAQGKDAKALLTTDPVDAYFLLNLEPEFDTAYPEKALETLNNAKLVVCFTPFATDAMREYADFILPITPFTETSGTFVNATGQWQSFHAASVPHADAKPGWKVLRALATLSGLSGFAYQSATAVREALKAQVNQDTWQLERQRDEKNLKLSSSQDDAIMAVFEWAMYRDNGLVRRSQALQDTIEPVEKSLVMNESLAKKLRIAVGDIVKLKVLEKICEMSVHIDNGVADNMVVIPAGFKETAGFGAHFASIEKL